MRAIDARELRAALAADPNPNKLVLEIGRDDLRNIRAAQLRIVLGRAASAASLPRVVWLSFDPFELNTVTWDTDVGLYASITELVPKATVTVVSKVATASPGFSYTYSASAVFEGPFAGNVPAADVGVLNRLPASPYPSLVFGLVQGATVQGNAAAARVASADLVLATFHKNLPPLPFVCVWLAEGLGSGTIWNPAPNPAIASYAGGVRELTFVFDPDKGMFVPR